METAKFQISAIDRKILRALQEDGRMTVQAIADRVGLSASPCLRRIRQMEKAGIITAYAARDRPEGGRAAGFGVHFDQARTPARRWNSTASPSAIAAWPEVMECYLMTGQFDYLLRVVCADLAAYEAFLREKLTQVEGVSSIEFELLARPDQVLAGAADLGVARPQTA